MVCRKNNFQNNKDNTINNLLKSACDSLGFYFIDNSRIARNHLDGDGIHLNYAGTEVLLENIAFCLNNFLWNKASKNTERFDRNFSIKHTDRGNGNCSKTDPCDTLEYLNELRLKNINKLVICHLNINSLYNTFDQLKLIIKNKVDILVIIETKLGSSFPDSHFIIDGFRQPYRLDRNEDYGGVMIFVSEDIPSKLIRKHTLPDDVEGMFIEINLEKRNG